MNKFLKVLFALAVCSSSIAKADDIYLGEPGYGGTGCPQGSASTILSPDYKTLTILFDQFMAMAGAGSPNGAQVDLKTCNIAIPVHVPQGLSVSVIGVDYRGVVSVPSGAMARFTAEYFLALPGYTARGPRSSKIFMGPRTEDYLIENDLVLTASVWSPCGKDLNLRVNASMLARSNRQLDDVLASVDSADITAGIVYALQWRSCY